MSFLLLGHTDAVSIGVTALIAAVLGVVLVKVLDHLRKKDAETQAQQILKQADQDASSRLKEAELEIKEKTLQQKAENDLELNKVREEFRDRERKLDKREELLS